MEDRTNYHSALLEIRELRSQLAQCEKERDRLQTRQQELLETVRRLSQETPFPEEAQDALQQRGVLLAEIGSARAENRRMHEETEHYGERIAALEKRNSSLEATQADLVGALKHARSYIGGLTFDSQWRTEVLDHLAAALTHSERAD